MKYFTQKKKIMKKHKLKLSSIFLRPKLFIVKCGLFKFCYLFLPEKFAQICLMSHIVSSENGHEQGLLFSW